MKFPAQRSYLITTTVIIALAAYITSFFPRQDFAVYYAAGRSLLAGRVDLYAADFANAGVMDYRYPPAFILMFAPFALFPFAVSAFLWASVGLAAVVAAFKQIAAAAGESLQTHRLKLALFLAGLLTAKYLLIALKYQNVHLLVVAAIFISFCLLLKNKLLPAALLMALAIAIKIFPILLLPYFAIKRQWRFLGMTACFVMMFALLPAYYFGINENIDLNQKWFARVVQESAFYELNGPPNLSIQGQTTRFLSPVDYEARAQDKAYPNVNFAVLEPNAARLIGNILAAVIGVSTFLVLFYRDRSARKVHPAIESDFGWSALSEFALLIPMVLLVGPRTNIIYFSALFLPFLVLVSAFFERRSVIIWIGLIAAIIAGVVIPLIPGAGSQRLFLVLGVDTIATTAVWAALGSMLVTRLHKIGKTDPTR